MRAKRFTALAIENFKPKTERYEVTDGSGLILFVGETGHKGWGIRYRRPDSRKSAKFMVGSWPAMSLAQARVAAAAAKLDVARDVDPCEAKKKAKAEAKAAATSAAADTVERWAEEFLRGRAEEDATAQSTPSRACFPQYRHPSMAGAQRPQHRPPGHQEGDP